MCQARRGKNSNQLPIGLTFYSTLKNSTYVHRHGWQGFEPVLRIKLWFFSTAMIKKIVAVEKIMNILINKPLMIFQFLICNSSSDGELQIKNWKLIGVLLIEVVENNNVAIFISARCDKKGCLTFCSWLHTYVHILNWIYFNFREEICK